MMDLSPVHRDPLADHRKDLSEQKEKKQTLTLNEYGQVVDSQGKIINPQYQILDPKFNPNNHLDFSYVNYEEDKNFDCPCCMYRTLLGSDESQFLAKENLEKKRAGFVIHGGNGIYHDAMFHKLCLEKWFDTTDSLGGCPTCRAPLTKDKLPPDLKKVPKPFGKGNIQVLYPEKEKKLHPSDSFSKLPLPPPETGGRRLSMPLEFPPVPIQNSLLAPAQADPVPPPVAPIHAAPIIPPPPLSRFARMWATVDSLKNRISATSKAVKNEITSKPLTYFAVGTILTVGIISSVYLWRNPSTITSLFTAANVTKNNPSTIPPAKPSTTITNPPSLETNITNAAHQNVSPTTPKEVINHRTEKLTELLKTNSSNSDAQTPPTVSTSSPDLTTSKQETKINPIVSQKSSTPNGVFNLRADTEGLLTTITTSFFNSLKFIPTIQTSLSPSQIIGPLLIQQLLNVCKASIFPKDYPQYFPKEFTYLHSAECIATSLLSHELFYLALYFNPFSNTSDLVTRIVGQASYSSIVTIICTVLATASYSVMIDYSVSKLYARFFPKKPEPVAPKKAPIPSVIAPELPEIQSAINSLNHPTRPFVASYILSSAGFAKSLFFTTIRSIGYLSLSILLAFRMITSDGRAFLRQNTFKAFTNVAGIFISLIGIAVPILGRAIYTKMTQDVSENTQAIA